MEKALLLLAEKRGLTLNASVFEFLGLLLLSAHGWSSVLSVIQLLFHFCHCLCSVLICVYLFGNMDKTCKITGPKLQTICTYKVILGRDVLWLLDNTS